jgi:AraC family transcriptional regulator
MDPVQKALWFVENKLTEEISLDEIARACHVSPFHLTRSFAACMGISLMRYVRGRRLTEAARKLASGVGDILGVAIENGYGSHEAFTRAFRDQFGLAPEQVRSRGHLQNLMLVEAILLDSTQTPEIDDPRIETLKQTQFAGLSQRYDCNSPAGIPGQWQRFAPYLGSIPGQVGWTTFGICSNFDNDGSFDYMCAVEVAGTAPLPAGFTTIVLDPRKYAVFLHKGHISGIRSTITAIWKNAIPSSGLKAAPAPSFERYGPEFNPQTGMGGLEIWVPIED